MLAYSQYCIVTPLIIAIICCTSTRYLIIRIDLHTIGTFLLINSTVQYSKVQYRYLQLLSNLLVLSKFESSKVNLPTIVPATSESAFFLHCLNKAIPMFLTLFPTSQKKYEFQQSYPANTAVPCCLCFLWLFCASYHNNKRHCPY